MGHARISSQNHLGLCRNTLVSRQDKYVHHRFTLEALSVSKSICYREVHPPLRVCVLVDCPGSGRCWRDWTDAGTEDESKRSNSYTHVTILQFWPAVVLAILSRYVEKAQNVVAFVFKTVLQLLQGEISISRIEAQGHVLLKHDEPIVTPVTSCGTLKPNECCRYSLSGEVHVEHWQWRGAI